MNEIKIKGSYSETLKYLQENLDPDELKGYKYLKPLQEIQKRALKESLGKPYIDPLCDFIIKTRLVGKVKDEGIIDALSYSYREVSRFIEDHYTDKYLNAYGREVIYPEFVHFEPTESIKAQLVEYKRIEAEDKADHFFLEANSR